MKTCGVIHFHCTNLILSYRLINEGKSQTAANGEIFAQILFKHGPCIRANKWLQNNTMHLATLAIYANLQPNSRFLPLWGSSSSFIYKIKVAIPSVLFFDDEIPNFFPFHFFIEIFLQKLPIRRSYRRKVNFHFLLPLLCSISCRSILPLGWPDSATSFSPSENLFLTIRASWTFTEVKINRRIIWKGDIPGLPR